MKIKNGKGVLLMFLLLLIFWMIIASEFNWVQLLVGSLAALLIVFYNFDLIFTNKEATRIRLKSLKAFLRIIYTLLKEIIKANINVVKIVLSKNMPLSPGFVTIRQPLKKDLNQAFYANSITLTPGTLTIDMSDDEILVHGLQVETVKDLEGSALEKAFIDFEGSEHD